MRRRPLVGLRTNTEGPGPKAANLTFYEIGYAEQGEKANRVPNGRVQEGRLGPGPAGSASPQAQRPRRRNWMMCLRASSKQTILSNSRDFKSDSGSEPSASGSWYGSLRRRPAARTWTSSSLMGTEVARAPGPPVRRRCPSHSSGFDGLGRYRHVPVRGHGRAGPSTGHGRVCGSCHVLAGSCSPPGDGALARLNLRPGAVSVRTTRAIGRSVRRW